jgi:hypothetical protein
VNLLSALVLLLAQAAAPTPQNTSPAAPVAQPSPDPASAYFIADVGLLLVAIKPANVADYELVIKTLQEALAKDTNPERQAAAKGWRVYKADAPDAKGNVLYVHIINPTVPAFDYRPSLLLDELIQDLEPELLSKYQGAFADPPHRLSLTELANMSVAPVAPPAEKKPDPPKKPGG